MATNIIIAILVFSVLVLFHEFGHYILAKAVGIGVIEFSLGMGPRILSFERKGTRYSWKAIPFGGSCAMVGEDEEDTSPNAFGSKPAWARFLVVFAGPAFNILLAFLLSLVLVGVGGINTAAVHQVTRGSSAEKAGIEAWKDSVTAINGKKIATGRDLILYTLSNPLDGSPVEVTLRRGGEERTVTVDPHVKGYRIGISYMADESAPALTSVTEGSPAEKAGLKTGDIVTAINGTALKNGTEMSVYLSEHPIDGSVLKIEIKRNGESLLCEMTPEPYEAEDLGFQAYYVYEPWDGNIGRLLSASLREVRYWLSYTVVSLRMLVSGRVGVRDLSGPVGIVSTIGSMVETGLENGGISEAALNVMTMMVLLSVNLGIMNLLPIPALDGGRILFILFELIFRRKVPPKAEGIIHLIGFVLLMALMVAVLFSDVLKLFGR